MFWRLTVLNPFPDEHLGEIWHAVRQFCQQELTPYLKTIPPHEYPRELLRLMGEAGYTGAAIPEAYGGSGQTLTEFLPIIEAIAAVDGSAALSLSAHHSLAASHILRAGTEEQKRRWLPELTSGERIGAWCFTDPRGGSNAFEVMGTTLRTGTYGRRILNGEKSFVTNGGIADLYVVTAKVESPEGQAPRFATCIVEKSANGIRTAPSGEKMGMRGCSTTSVFFDDVEVAPETVLDPTAGGGTKYVIREVLFRGRIGIAALALGLARDSLERALRYAKERQVKGGALSEQQMTQNKIAEMYAGWLAAWQTVFYAASLADEGKPFAKEACAAKLLATETALTICDEALQIFGGYGYMTDYKVEKNYRDARLLTIGEGTSEVLKLTIAREILGR